MKNYPCIILCCFILVLGCTTRKQFIKHNRFCEFNDEITLQEKKLTLTTEEDSILSKQYNFIREDNKQIDIYLFRHPNNGTITVDITNKKINIRKILVYKKNKIAGSFFLYTIGDLIIGKEIEYNTEGEISKMTDHTQNDKYPICFKEAIRLVERKIGKTSFVFNIKREKNETSLHDTLYHWDVFVEEPIKNKEPKTWLYRINAENGILIDKLKVVSNPS